MKRAVLMIVDGLRADLVISDLTPRLTGLAKHSRVFRRHRCVFPSATRVNSASIATGCFPGNHGLAGNSIALDEGEGLKPVSVGPADFRDRLRRATGRTLHRPTLAERVREHGGAIIYSNSSAGAAHMQDPDGHAWLYHRSGSFSPGLKPITGEDRLNVTYDGRGDATTTQRFCEALQNASKAVLLVLWICEPDHSQHALELGSPEHRAVIAGSDECVGKVSESVAALRARDEDILFIVCSDHGHETIDGIIPVEQLLVDAGLKESTESTDVVLASSGMGALIYLSQDAAPRWNAIADWLRTQNWVARVFAGPQLAEIEHRTDTALAIAFGMAKTDRPNRFGIWGLGHVVADPFMPGDASGRGQHGGLGPYESNPFLLISGGGFAGGITHDPSNAVDIAPTVLRHLDLSTAGMDGKPLSNS